MTLRVGVVGTGIMGADHVETLHRRVGGVEVSLVADVDAARAQAVAGRVGAGVAADGPALIADPAVDAVIVASHDATHAALVRAALAAGKPVLCEKPLAPTVAECAELARADPGGLISVGFMRRFDPVYVELKAALGTVGAPLLVHCTSRGVSAAPTTTSEYSVTGAAIHEFDIVPWLLGAPIVDVAWAAPRQSSLVTGMQDPQLALLRTADGVLTTLEVFLNAHYGYVVGCEVVCESGALTLGQPVDYAADWRPRFADAYRLELQAWVDALAAGRAAPLATVRDGLVATAVAEAVIASMHDGGRFVAVDVP